MNRRRGGRAALLGFLAACGRVDFEPVADAPPPECRAQRVVELVAGGGGLGWLTLQWPAPAVIRGYQPTYAYDDPALAVALLGDPHPLYARRNLWQGTGLQPLPSAYIAGYNETHSAQPISITTATGVELIAAGSVLQAPLRARVPVVQLGFVGPYGPAPGQAPALAAATVADAVNQLGDPSLAPDPSVTASWHSAAAPQEIVDLADQLAFTANALQRGVVATVQLPAMRDDPHMAFSLGYATAYADDLTLVLDAFYRQLAAVPEPACLHLGAPISLADNVVMIIVGDTPKAMFNSAWGDGTTSSSNLFYVRANGFTIPGWFGEITPTDVTWFDPTTGALDPTVTAHDAATYAVSAALYAIARGDASAITSLTSYPYAGLVP